MRYPINLNSDCPLGEYKDLNIRVYLPKGSKEHLGDKNKLELVVCDILNKGYEEAVKKVYWKSDQLWFKPTKGEED